jgi:hypothetical protein
MRRGFLYLVAIMDWASRRSWPGECRTQRMLTSALRRWRTAPKGGQFVLHAQALHGNPYDGHTLGPVIAALEALTGVEARRIHLDKGYRGHTYPNRFKVWISGQVRRAPRPSAAR